MNIFLNWESADCSNSLSQRIEYKKIDETDWTLHASVPCGVSSIYINNLEDDVVYEFRVGSLCGSALDNAVIYTTRTVIIKINCVTFDDVDVSSNSIEYEFSGNSYYQSYDIVLLDSSGNELDRQTEQSNSTISGIFEDLVPNTSYKLRIEPSTYFGKFSKLDCPEEVFITQDVEIPDCEDAEFDIIFVNDESGSIGSNNFNNYIIPGITQIVRSISQLIVNQQIRISYKSFATIKRNLFNLSDNYATIFNNIRNAPFSQGGTYTSGGLRAAYDELIADNRDVPTKVILVTDGDPNLCGNIGVNNSGSVCLQNIALEESEEVATLIKNLNKGGRPVELITVGVVNANNTWLSNTVASDPSKHYVAAKFEDFEEVAQEIALSICLNIPPPIADPCESCTNVAAFFINTVDQTCIRPNNVQAQLLTLQILCNAPTNVVSTLRIKCLTPGSVTAILL